MLRRDVDYTVDEKSRSVTLTEEGVPKAEGLLRVENLYEPAQMTLLHHLLQALRAHALYKREKDYTVKDGKVVIVDEFTGRLMPGRRWSDGLHQAVEAKENVKIERENQTLATITFQNYFRMYRKLSGMTGTAETEAAEFEKIYELEVVPIPTNRELVRKEEPDVVYRTEREKLKAIADEIRTEQRRGRPVLVGTTSIEKSERLARLLKRQQVPHVVLNAKYHQREAEIVAQAGRGGSVTIATNMAGRGTDILLGGSPEEIAKARLRKEGVDWAEASGEVWEGAVSTARGETRAAHDEVVALGGLHIVGTERHEARRIDNQLRGRAGRQGDPGSSRFFLSLEDDLMRIFGSDRMSGLMQRLGMEEGVPVEAGMVTRAIERAQKTGGSAELLLPETPARIRRCDEQAARGDLRAAPPYPRGTVDQRGYVLELAGAAADALVDNWLSAEADPDDWDYAGLREAIRGQYGFIPEPDAVRFDELGRDEARSLLAAAVPARYEEKESEIGAELMRIQERLHHAPYPRCAVEGPPVCDGPPQAGHRSSRLRAARSADRIQEGVLLALRGDVGPHRAGNRAAPLRPQAGARRAGAGAGAPSAAGRPERRPPELRRRRGGGGPGRRWVAGSGPGGRAAWPRADRRGEERPEEDRTERALSLRQRQEVQEVPRRLSAVALPAAPRVALTFDDVLLQPRYSEVLPAETDLKTRFSRRIALAIPLVSAAMDTVTEARLAIAIAQLGGIGVIHRNLSAEAQAAEVAKVKRSESGMVVDPVTVSPDAPVSLALGLMERHGISGLPVIDGGKLVGILTSRDLRFETRGDLRVRELMTRAPLHTAPLGTTLDEAKAILHEHRVEKLPVLDEHGALAGLLTVKDIQKAMAYPDATKDELGRLRCAAAVGVGRAALERAERLAERQVDAIVVDTAHGHTGSGLDTVRRLKRALPDAVDLVAGNIATPEAARDLVEAGADGVKVGMGPGSICTTRVVAGTGMPQFSAIRQVRPAAAVPVIADGGVRFSGDIVKAIAAGADSVMVGNLFAGSDESPGETILFQGRTFKSYRGMGSLGAMSGETADRYYQDGRPASKLAPEGIEGRVPTKGPLAGVVEQLVGGLRSGMGYTGCRTISELAANAEFVQVTGAGRREGHAHDVVVTKEAPNYRLE